MYKWHSEQPVKKKTGMPITDQILDQLLADCKSPGDLMGEQGLLRQLTKKLAERALEADGNG